MNIDNIIERLREPTRERLKAGERYRIKCYLDRREWQLEQFQIGWNADWSQEELIFALRQQLKTIRKMVRMGAFGRKRTLAPMFRAALSAEIELAKVDGIY